MTNKVDMIPTTETECTRKAILARLFQEGELMDSKKLTFFLEGEELKPVKPNKTVEKKAQKPVQNRTIEKTSAKIGRASCRERVCQYV